MLHSVRAIQKRLRQIKTPTVLLVSSAAACGYPNFGRSASRQDPNFYYLSSSLLEDATLLLSSKLDKPLLICSKRSGVKVAFDGQVGNQRSLARQLGAELLVSDHPSSLIWPRLRGIRQLYHNSSALAAQVVQQLAGLDVEYRSEQQLPLALLSCEEFLAPLRLIKSRTEVAQIERAATISAAALLESLPLIKGGVKEYQLAATLDYWIRMLGCTNAFDTIVASGRSAATLHYRQQQRTLKRGELVLIDFGASYNNFASDITRVLPVAGRFNPLQREIYSIVLDAQRTVIGKVKAGVKLGALQTAAVETLTAGLVELKVLRGKLSKLVSAAAYRKYFPHSIGHNLGLDVHDLSFFSRSAETVLEPGMVITVEPGLYFERGIGKIPACGVRIEDDLLVTKGGCRVLTEMFPKDLEQIEHLF